nr:hypothetical protein [Tanacetum cinerariifolium]
MPPIYDDDNDYEESTIPLNDIISQEPPSNVITTFSLVLPIEDPKVSLIMGNEELNTIPEKESDEFIKSSVDDLVLIPSESEDTSGSDKNIESKDSYDSNLDGPDLLVTPFSDANKDECFDSGGDDDEINVLDCEDSYYDSEGDILYLESLLNDDLVHHDPSIPAMSVASILEGFTDEPPLEENDYLFDLESKNDDWKTILYDAPIDDLMTEDKVFDLGIHDQIFLQHMIALDLEVFRARGFVHCPLELQSLAYGNPIPRSY